VTSVKKPKRPRDPNQLAKNIVELATGETSDPVIGDDRNPHAVALGRLGGLKGGRARAEALTANQRSVIAKRAAQRRWNRGKK
jgi:hypothetical protein